MLALTELPLYVSQQLRHPPLQYNHLDRTYAFRQQPGIDAL
jgi:hypothetical protein